MKLVIHFLAILTSILIFSGDAFCSIGRQYPLCAVKGKIKKVDFKKSNEVCGSPLVVDGGCYTLPDRYELTIEPLEVIRTDGFSVALQGFNIDCTLEAFSRNNSPFALFVENKPYWSKIQDPESLTEGSVYTGIAYHPRGERLVLQVIKYQITDKDDIDLRSFSKTEKLCATGHCTTCRFGPEKESVICEYIRESPSFLNGMYENR